MSTIPASALVQVLPNVLNAGGLGLVMNGIILTHNTRVPTGAVLSFPNDGVSVGKFFGLASFEATIAAVYFAGFNTSTQKPATILFAQYNQVGVSADMIGGPVSQLTIAQLAAISGTISIVVDNYAHANASLDLSASTSYSSAAAILQTALNSALSTIASVTGSIASSSASVTGSIAGNVLTVTHITSGTLAPGAVLTGTGVTTGTMITTQLSGTTGGLGTYAVNKSQVVVSETIGATYGTMTVTAVSSGTISVGQIVGGSGVTTGTQVIGLGTGTGLSGTYFVTPAQTIASEALTTTSAPVTVTYDSTSGGFIITSGSIGASSNIAFATGTAAASLFLTQATGAVLSQGADAQTPGPYMTNLSQVTQNWATFLTLFDPDGGSGNTQKQAFAAWVNTTNKRYCYLAWDTDITPTASLNATTSLGNILMQSNSDGTACIYDPTFPVHLAAFVAGTAASIDFQAENGRITFAFRGQDGLVAGVTNQTAANNLTANGYNFYGAYATANAQFVEFQTGIVSGEFEWLDSYINQIWLNNALQLALMNLLQQVNSIPYNTQGYDLMKAACADPINNALNFGAIRAGVTLSQLQIAEINSAAGVKVSDVLQTQGWYLQVKDAQPQVRQARQSPPCNLWYMDGESIQKIVLNSTLVQ